MDHGSLKETSNRYSVANFIFLLCNVALIIIIKGEESVAPIILDPNAHKKDHKEIH